MNSSHIHHLQMFACAAVERAQLELQPLLVVDTGYG